MHEKRWITCHPGERFDLSAIDPGADGGLDKEAGRRLLEENGERLQDLQERLYAEGEQSLLIVLQAMDAGGKDGAIKKVCGAFNPQGVQVTPFRVPTEGELARDFLWRVHRRVPRRGMIGVFNRSHYEDVLVVRVKQLVPDEVWRRRYDQINAFERLLADTGTRVVKIYLHISPDEQAERLRARRDRPHKRWKLRLGDLEDRRLWHDFRHAYEDALHLCNTASAPWHVVPADRKWYRDLAVSELLLRVLEEMDPRFPPPEPGIEEVEIPEV